MSKFDPLNWSLLEDGKVYEAYGGRVWVRSAWKIALYVSVEGVEALAGVGNEIDVKVDKGSEFRVAALTPDNTEIFGYSPVPLNYSPSGEVFTNADRMPHESGNVAEVTKALRLFKLESSHIMRNLRAERNALAREKAQKKADPEPVIEEDSEDEGDDTPPAGDDTVKGEE